MADDDYPAVGLLDDEEQKKLYDYPPVMAPGDIGTGMTQAAPVDTDYAPAMSGPSLSPKLGQDTAPTSAQSTPALGSTEQLEQRGLQSHETPKTYDYPPVSSTPRPRPEDFAPKPLTGWQKFGRGLEIFAGGPSNLSRILDRPQVEAHQHYEDARQAYEDEQKDELAKEKQASETGLQTAQATEAGAKAHALENPPAKEPNPENDAYQFFIRQGMTPGEAYQHVKELAEKPTAPKGTKEQLQAQIVEAENKGDTAGAAKLKQQMKDIDPEGQQRIEVQTGNQGNARSDRSYTLQSKRLDDLRKPVEGTMQRIGRLNDTLAQNSPQADALVAPELLSIMAGGQGSGLRMNEAEISRIVGGRSAWETLKANIQHWSTDPNSARSITPDQQKQIRSLVGAVQQKLAQKQKIMDDSEEEMLGADDPRQHRKIVEDARRKLDAIDSAAAEGQGGGKDLSEEEARDYLRRAGGDKDKARSLAKADGRTF